MIGVIDTCGVPAEVAGTLRGLYAKVGNLHECDVVDIARDESSPLHRYFEWDDDAAAEAYRLVQAAELIRRVRVHVITSEGGEPIKVRAFVARREIASGKDRGSPGSYVAIEDVAGRTAWESSLRESIRRDLMRIRRKYDDIGALFEVAEEVWSLE